jgi:hypothetical protein
MEEGDSSFSSAARAFIAKKNKKASGPQSDSAEILPFHMTKSYPHEGELGGLGLGAIGARDAARCRRSACLGHSAVQQPELRKKKTVRFDRYVTSPCSPRPEHWLCLPERTGARRSRTLRRSPFGTARASRERGGRERQRAEAGEQGRRPGTTREPG